MTNLVKKRRGNGPVGGRHKGTHPYDKKKGRVNLGRRRSNLSGKQKAFYSHAKRKWGSVRTQNKWGWEGLFCGKSKGGIEGRITATRQRQSEKDQPGGG